MHIFQHAHIKSIKTVANLTNNKDVSMSVLATKELHTLPASDPVPPDQYKVECASLSDSNLNVQS
jgi:hypothetical protein